jgi:predicted nuclease of predicted toxin-antitoxin system
LRRGPPPCILWLTCGNVTNRHLRQILAGTLAQAVALLAAGDVVVEIGDRNGR